MRHLAATTVLLLLAVPGPDAQTPAPRKTALEGTWVLTALNGQPPPASRGETALAVTGDRYEQLINGRSTETGAIVVSVVKDVINLDFLIGATGPGTGTKQLGRCKLAAAELTCKLNQPGAPNRPGDLSPEPGHFQFVAKKR